MATITLKNCPICNKSVHPRAKARLCQEERCADKMQVHQRCIGLKLQKSDKLTLACDSCKRVSAWGKNKGFNFGKDMRWWIWFLSIGSTVPMIIVKVLAMWLELNKRRLTDTETTAQSIADHVFSSLVLASIAVGMYKSWGFFMSIVKWFGRKFCCCFTCCCRRGDNEILDIY